MGKIYANVVYERKEDIENLIKCFFEEYNEANFINVEGMQVVVNIFFDEQPPKKILNVLCCNCYIIKFSNEEDKKGEAIWEDSKIELGQCVQKEEVREEPEQCIQTEEVPELEELVAKAESFEEFLQLVTQWLNQGETRKNFIKELLVSVKDVDEVRWKNIEASMKSKNMKISINDQNWFRKLTLTKTKTSAIELLKKIKKYENYSFQSEENKKPNSIIELSSMKGSPEFEQIVSNIDKTKTIEEKVEYVLNAMGLEKASERHKEIIRRMANSAVKLKGKISMEDIFVNANIKDNQVQSKIVVMKFITSFVGEKNNVGIKGFFEDLRKAVTN